VAEVSVQLLGPVTVRVDDAAVTLAGTRVASLGEDVYDSQRRAGMAAGLSTPDPIR
jgi:hypothetical protein